MTFIYERQPQDLGADYRLYRFTQQRERVNSELSHDSDRKTSPVPGYEICDNSFALEALFETGARAKTAYYM